MIDDRDPLHEVLDELHEIRLAIDAQFDHDPDKYLAYLQELHRQVLREGCVEVPRRPQKDESTRLIRGLASPQ